MPLECGQSLQQGESIWSTNEQYRLTMQDDGNLVLYDGKNQPHWASNTWRHGEPPYRTTMQDDGNLVLYDVRGTATWASNTWGKGPSRCAPRFRTRRCLCQTSIFWRGRRRPLREGFRLARLAVLCLRRWLPGLQRPEAGRVRGKIGGFKNVRAIARRARCRCVLQDDRNLVVYAANSQQTWASGTGLEPEPDADPHYSYPAALT